jgi:hypothetical protein
MERAPYGVIAGHHAGDESERDHHQQRHLHDRRRQYLRVLPASQRPRVSSLTIDLMNRAARRAGSPEPLLHSVAEPTLDVAKAMLRYPGIRLNVVTVARAW